MGGGGKASAAQAELLLTGGEGPARAQAAQAELITLLLSALLALSPLALGLLGSQLVSAYVIPSRSMDTTLMVGDVVLAEVSPGPDPNPNPNPNLNLNPNPNPKPPRDLSISGIEIRCPD